MTVKSKGGVLPATLLPLCLALTTLWASGCEPPQEGQSPHYRATSAPLSSEITSETEGAPAPPPCGTVSTTTQRRDLVRAASRAEDPFTLARSLAAAGDYDRALRALERAVARSADQNLDPRLLGDLSAIHLERYRCAGRPGDLLEAHTLVSEALAVEAHETNGAARLRYTRFLVERELGLRHVTRQAAAALLESGADQLRFPDVEAELAAALSQSDAREAELYEQLLEAEEEGLGDWASAVLAGDPGAAARTLAELDALSRRAARETGNDFLAEALDAIRRAENESRVEELARAHRDHAEGMASYRHADYPSARPRLESARDIFTAAGSPYSLHAELYAAICDYFGDQQSALVRFQALATDLADRSYPLLSGYLHWMLGNTLVVIGDFAASLAASEEGRAQFDRAGATREAANLDANTAEVLSQLGQGEEAWRRRIRALRALDDSGPAQALRRRHTALAEALRARPPSALEARLLVEATANAERWGSPIGRTEVALQTALHERDAGRVEAALENFAAARRFAEQTQEPLRSRLVADVSTHWGALEGLVDRRAGLAKLAEAEHLYRASATRFRTPRVAAARARIEATRSLDSGWSQVTTALRDLAVMEVAVGSQSGRQVTARERSDFRKSWSEVFESAFEIAAALDRRDRPSTLEARPKALELTVREKAWLWRGVPLSGAASETLVRLQEPPPGALVVVSRTESNRLHLWRVEGGRVEHQTHDADQFARHVRLLRASLRGGELDPEASRWLAHALLGDRDLSHIEQLNLVPGGTDWGLPAAALRDPRTGVVLGATHRITVSPTWASALADEPALWPEARLLAVAPPTPAPAPFDYLPTLPGAVAEVDGIAAHFVNPRVLRREQANGTTIRSYMEGVDVFHYAGHVVSGPASAQNGTRVPYLALAATAGSDSLLEASSLFEEHRPSWVVLSACGPEETGAALADPYTNAPALMAAMGVPVVVAAGWPVDDVVTVETMLELFAEARSGRTASSAFRDLVGRAVEESETLGIAEWAVWSVYKGGVN